LRYNKQPDSKIRKVRHGHRLQTCASRGGAGTAARGATVAESGTTYLYHYTSREAAENIAKVGLNTEYSSDGFIYLTNKANLSPLQAQIELALPANRALPNTLLQIDATGLNPAIIRSVQGNLPGMGAGGGMEFLFNQNIPASLIKIIK
jgi:hypothetical protein